MNDVPDYLPRSNPNHEAPQPKPRPSDAEIEAILRSSSAGSIGASSIIPAFLAPLINSSGLLARAIFFLAAIHLMATGVHDQSIRAESSGSLIAENINSRGRQTFGLGLVVFGMALMPVPAGARKD